MADDARQGAERGGGYGPYAPGDNPADPNEHRHGDVVHSHAHKGPHEHGDDYEYDEAHDLDEERRLPPSGG
jgi:hypothetical protein